MTDPHHPPAIAPASDRQSRSGQLSAQKRRIIAPDLARGLALLGIALANIATAWTTAEGADSAASLGGVYDGSVLDQAAVIFGAMFVHVRGLPMFSTLLGFGVGLIAMSLWRRAYPRSTARWVLIRRYALLAAFGALHMVFLFFGDIMVLYGLSGIVLALLMPLRDRTLMWIAGVLLGLQFVGYTAMGAASLIFPELGELMSTQSPIADTYGGWVLNNLLFLLLAPVSFIPQVLTLIPVMIIGFVWARRGVLTDPDAHGRLLRRWVWVGVAVVLLIGLPRGLAETGVIAPGSTGLWMMLNTSFGLLTGPAIVAGVTLACRGLQRRIDDAPAAGRDVRLSPPLVALAALGKRSMSGYILQSLLFVILVLPFGFGLGQNEGAFQLLIWATVVWLITLLAAYGLELAGRPGPFEWVHRRLSYGRDGLRDRYVPEAGRPMPLPPQQPEPRAEQTDPHPQEQHPDAPENPYRRD